MATIKDVARLTGVSATTVSNVIHGHVSRVSPDMVKKIQTAIAQLHYVPNMSARALKSSASKIIAVINHLVPLKSGGFFQDPFHGALLAGIERALRQSGYYLMVRTIDTVPELLSLLNNWQIDGLIVTGIFPSPFYLSLQEQKTPFLLIDSYIDDDSVLQVRLEDEQGGYLAGQHLAQMGHRDVLFCGPSIHAGGVVARRFKGFERALKAHGLQCPKENVYQSEIGIDQGIALGLEIARRNDFTAVFATADILAAGILSGLQQAGRAVPQDISVIGFDDLNIARLTSPPLTTVRQDVVARGMLAAQMLVTQLQTPDQGEKRMVMPVTLIERSSVRRRTV